MFTPIKNNSGNGVWTNTTVAAMWWREFASAVELEESSGTCHDMSQSNRLDGYTDNCSSGDGRTWGIVHSVILIYNSAAVPAL